MAVSVCICEVCHMLYCSQYLGERNRNYLCVYRKRLYEEMGHMVMKSV